MTQQQGSESDFKLLEDLKQIGEEFGADENLNHYEPWDYMKARQKYVLYRLNQLSKQWRQNEK